MSNNASQNPTGPRKENPDFGPKVTSGKGRLNHVFLVKPDDSKFGQGKHRVTILFDKKACDGSSTDPLKPLKDACIAQAKKAFPDVELSKVVMPIKNGDEKAKYAGFAGMWTATAKCKPRQTPDKNTGLVRPGTYDVNRKLTEGNEIYNGMYGRLCASPQSYKIEKELMVQLPNGNIEKRQITEFGIRLQLQSVQGLGYGERLAGGATDDFNDGYQDSGAPAPTQGGEDF